MIWSKEREQRLCELRAAGISFSKIAEEFNVSKSTIAGKCNRMGLCKKDRVKQSSKVIAIEQERKHAAFLFAKVPRTMSKRELREMLRFAVRNTK